MKEYLTPDAAVIRTLCENGPHDVDVRQFILDMPDAAPPRILTTYHTTTPESVAQGDYADNGWEDQEGVDMTPDEWDREEGRSVVDNAVKWLQDKGALEPSDSHGGVGTWYSTIDPERNYRTGGEKFYQFHLKGFLEPEQEEIFRRMTRRGN